MRRNLRIGLVLGIAVLMLLPVYARAQMSLTLAGANVEVGPTVMVNISADQTQTINFSVNSSLSNPVFTWVGSPSLNPAPWNNGNFSWDTTNFSGTYLFLCQATAGQETEQLAVMITVNPSTGGSPSPTPTTYSLTVNVNPTTGAAQYITVNGTQYTTFPATVSGLSGSVIVSATANANYAFSNWTENTSFVGSTPSSATNSITMNSSHNITANFTATGGGGGGTGTYSPQVATAVKLNQLSGGLSSYGYYQPSKYVIPKGATVYFLADPTGFGITISSSLLNFIVADYTQGQNGVIVATLIQLDSSDNLWRGKPPFTMSDSGNQNFSYNDYQYQAGKKYLIVVQEKGVKDTPISIWWSVN